STPPVFPFIYHCAPYLMGWDVFITFPEHVLSQIIITTEIDYTNNTSQIFVIFSYYYSVFTVVTFLFSKVLIADNSV
ncbi:hypothetical protein, partial [Escherichia coli]|uniref:hypothetical protein n=1 Tax=Escherichia coli TaxID=562 RepID=UPI0019D071B5